MMLFACTEDRSKAVTGHMVLRTSNNRMGTAVMVVVVATSNITITAPMIVAVAVAVLLLELNRISTRMTGEATTIPSPTTGMVVGQEEDRITEEVTEVRPEVAEDEVAPEVAGDEVGMVVVAPLVVVDMEDMGTKAKVKVLEGTADMQDMADMAEVRKMRVDMGRTHITTAVVATTAATIEEAEAGEAGGNRYLYCHYTLSLERLCNIIYAAVLAATILFVTRLTAISIFDAKI